MIVTAAIVAQASLSLAPSAVDATAQSWFTSLQAGKVLDARQLDAEERQIFTAAHAREFAGPLRDLGAPTTFARELTQSGHGSVLYAYRVEFANGTKTMFTFVVHGNAISGLGFAQAPDAAHIRAWYDALAKGSLLDANVSSELKAAMNSDTLADIAKHLSANGAPATFTLYDINDQKNRVVFQYKITYASADPLIFTYAQSSAGVVETLYFKPQR